MAYNKTVWVNDQTELNAENMNHIENGIEDAYNVSLLAVSDTAPSQCEEGDKYYNTEDKVIYTATGTDTWGETGEEPLQDILYVVFEEKNTYAWNGIDMLSVGGGSGSQVVVEPDEPTEDTKLLIEESDLDFQGLEIADEYTTGNNVAYSADYINNHIQGDITTNGDGVKCGYKIDGNDVYIQKIQKTGTYTGTQTISLGLNGKTITDFQIIGNNNDGHFVLPYINPSTSIASSRGFYINNNNDLVSIFGQASFSSLDIMVKYY